MGTVPVPSSEAANLGILSELMGREVVEKLWFERFTSEDIREGLSSMEQRPAVAPIKRYTEFQTKGMDHMLITVDKPYTEAEFHGDAIVTGHGEKDKWDYSRLYINQIQKPIEGPGRMGNQRIKVLDIIARERPKITTYMARKREEHTVSAMYEGFS
ncbi:MAG: DUF4043 family protein, partial [Candidatus Zixiibacteriota bacterium]